MMPYCISVLGYHWFRLWPVAWSAPSHALSYVKLFSIWSPEKWVNCEPKYKKCASFSRKCIWKYHLQNVNHFVLASMCNFVHAINHDAQFKRYFSAEENSTAIWIFEQIMIRMLLSVRSVLCLPMVWCHQAPGHLQTQCLQITILLANNIHVFGTSTTIIKTQ